MSIFEKKQGLFSRGIKPESKKAPAPVKEIKKDTSIFGKESSIKKTIFEQRLKDPKLFSTIRLPGKKIEELGKKLFAPYKDFIQKTSIPKVKDELKKGKWGRFKDMSSEDKIKAKIIIKEVLEK